jgi:formylmethanofuran:tetrahydromethanopterin formyltransferase
MAIPGAAQAVSAINQMGGGVAFANGGVVPQGSRTILPPIQPAANNQLLMAMQEVVEATRTRQVVLTLPSFNDAQNQVNVARSNTTI